MYARIIVFIIHSLILTDEVAGSPKFNQLYDSCYAIQRDINIAYIGSINEFFLAEDGSKQCMRKLYPNFVYYAEGFRYAIDEINVRQDLLPNVSLGYIILNSCSSDLIGLGMSMYLVPDQNDTHYFPNDELITCSDGQYKRFQNVKGVVGGTGSGIAIMTIPVFSIFEIPVIESWATSDELSDKARFPFSIRLASPDLFQAQAMIELLVHFNWTYASIVYHEGTYGEGGAKNLKKTAKNKGICIAAALMIRSLHTDNDIREIAETLIENKKARIILTFAYSFPVGKLVHELVRMGYGEYFIWFGSDGVSPQRMDSKAAKHLDASFFMRRIAKEHIEFTDYINSLTPKMTNNPWLLRRWEEENDCTWDLNVKERQSCQKFENITTVKKIDASIPAGIAMDSAYVYANALNSLIKDKCPTAFSDKFLLRQCITGPSLLKYLKNVSLTGALGPIVFDKNGDSVGYTHVVQYNSNTGQDNLIALFDGLTRSITVLSDRMVWPWSLKRPPDSVCSYPCEYKQYYIQKELPCCWDCRKCRDNEIIVNNQTGCEQCPLFTWPDEESARECIQIKPTIIEWSSPTIIGLVSFVTFGCLLYITIVVLFVKKKEEKIIKASSQQLMAIILSGIMTAFVTAFVFLMEPQIPSCFATRLGFNFSVSLIYGPLVVKTSRVYRIFSAGKYNKKPTFIGNTDQMLMVVILLSIQLFFCISSIYISYPEPIYRMPVETVKYVEVQCSLPLAALLPPLSFNILLSIICAAFGFITRKLPANYNESWFIFVSVATTSFLWVVFLPAYFTAFYSIHQVILLASCLLINGLITLVCLYLPKLYAVYFVDEARMNVQVGVNAGASTIGSTTNTIT